MTNTERKDSTRGSSSTFGLGVESDAGVSVPLTAETKVKLQAHFEQQFQNSETTGSQVDKSAIDIFTDEHKVTQEVTVSPTRRLTVKQKLINCGVYELKTIIIQSGETEISDKTIGCAAKLHHSNSQSQLSPVALSSLISFLLWLL